MYSYIIYLHLILKKKNPLSSHSEKCYVWKGKVSVYLQGHIPQETKNGACLHTFDTSTGKSENHLKSLVTVSQ